MASGEIRLSGTISRRMPVLAQSQLPQIALPNVSLYPALDPNYFGVSGSDSGSSIPDAGASANTVPPTGFQSQQDSNFMIASGAVVGTSSALGVVAGSAYAMSELPSALAAAATYAGAGASSTEVFIIGAASAISDVGAMGMVGATLGAAAGVASLPVFGAGYFIGSQISPWVNRNLIDPFITINGYRY